MRLVLGVFALGCAAPLQAAETIYDVVLKGTITEQIGEGTAPIGPGTEVVLTARFDSSWVVDWGDTGY